MSSDERTTVVAISRQLGSGGSIVGKSVAQAFGWRYADREILHEAAGQLHADDAELAPFEERVETLWERLAPVFLFGVASVPAPLPPLITGPGLLGVERAIMKRLTARESAVIVGRGSTYVMRGHPGLITVFLHASEAVRSARLAARLEGSQRDRAVEMVRQSDRQRSEFNKSLSGLEWTDATQYDLCLDTSSTGLDTVADIVVALVRRRTLETEQGGAKA